MNDCVSPMDPDGDYHAIVRNIPSTFRSKDLRWFFSDFVESNSFKCFHFRHRPEIQISDSQPDKPLQKRCCCVVKFRSHATRQLFINKFNSDLWIDRNMKEYRFKCVVLPIRASDGIHDAAEASTSEKSISLSDLGEMIELNPPSDFLPQGNVGTPTSYFRGLVQQCRMPPTLIKKLGLDFKSGRTRKYGAVPPPFSGYPTTSTSSNPYYQPVTNSHDRLLRDERDPDFDANEPNEDAEEWERHEALHEIPEHDDRANPLLFEEEQEVTWEKGGPGLVFYTDDFYFDQQERDCDVLWADDWDVDYRIYETGDFSEGDKDGRDGFILRSEEIRDSTGRTPSCFTKRNDSRKSSKRKRRYSDGDGGESDWDHFGSFEKYTSGFGRRIMESQGWADGKGLGSELVGRSVPIPSDGQHPLMKKGFGYRGEKMIRFGLQKRKVQHSINTKYDDPLLSDPKETLMRRTELTTNSHR